jgi:hypothetical protein
VAARSGFLLKVASSAEAGLINHNTTTEERERDREGRSVPHTHRPYMNLHAHAGLRRLERAVVNWGEGLLHVAFMLVCLALFFPPAPFIKGGESHKEIGLPVALYFSRFR